MKGSKQQFVVSWVDSQENKSQQTAGVLLGLDETEVITSFNRSRASASVSTGNVSVCNTACDMMIVLICFVRTSSTRLSLLL